MTRLLPDELWQAAIDLQEYFSLLKLPFCFIGGIAVQRWGQPRVTNDVDMTVLTGFGNERPLVEKVLLRFQPRVKDLLQFALQTRVLLLRDARGTCIDISLGGMPFEQRMLERSSLWGTPFKTRIRTCSAEDLVILKAFADRPHDWIDVQRVLVRQASAFDRALVENELQVLAQLKEEPEIMERLTTVFRNNPAIRKRLAGQTPLKTGKNRKPPRKGNREK